MKVYLLTTGAYDNYGVQGVYSTPEKAMAAWPRGTWVPDHGGDGWWLELPTTAGYDDCANVEPFELDKADEIAQA